MGTFTCTCHITSIFGYQCLSTCFALAFVISQPYYVTNNYNTYISAASGRNLGKLVWAGGLGGSKAELWWCFRKYKTNKTWAGLNYILFILNLEIYLKESSLDHFWGHFFGHQSQLTAIILDLDETLNIAQYLTD